jgi:hypothetical protein
MNICQTETSVRIVIVRGVGGGKLFENESPYARSSGLGGSRRGIRDHHRRAGRIEHFVHALRRQYRIDRNIRRADLPDRQHRHHKTVAACNAQTYQTIRAEFGACTNQAVRETIRGAIQFVVGVAASVANERASCRRLGRVVLDQMRHKVASKS